MFEMFAENPRLCYCSEAAEGKTHLSCDYTTDLCVSLTQRENLYIKNERKTAENNCSRICAAPAEEYDKLLPPACLNQAARLPRANLIQHLLSVFWFRRDVQR